MPVLMDSREKVKEAIKLRGLGKERNKFFHAQGVTKYVEGVLCMCTLSRAEPS